MGGNYFEVLTRRGARAQRLNGAGFSRLSQLRDERGTQAAVEAIDGEIASVHGENFSEAFALCNPEERGIGKIHGTIGVLAHEFADSRSVGGVERKELQGASL